MQYCGAVHKFRLFSHVCSCIKFDFFSKARHAASLRSLCMTCVRTHAPYQAVAQLHRGARQRVQRSSMVGSSKITPRRARYRHRALHGEEPSTSRSLTVIHVHIIQGYSRFGSIQGPTPAARFSRGTTLESAAPDGHRVAVGYVHAASVICGRKVKMMS
jgi:hypothetical protein